MNMNPRFWDVGTYILKVMKSACDVYIYIYIFYTRVKRLDWTPAVTWSSNISFPLHPKVLQKPKQDGVLQETLAVGGMERHESIIYGITKQMEHGQLAIYFISSMGRT